MMRNRLKIRTPTLFRWASCARCVSLCMLREECSNAKRAAYFTIDINVFVAFAIRLGSVAMLEFCVETENFDADAYEIMNGTEAEASKKFGSSEDSAIWKWKCRRSKLNNENSEISPEDSLRNADDDDGYETGGGVKILIDTCQRVINSWKFFHFNVIASSPSFVLLAVSWVIDFLAERKSVEIFHRSKVNI